MLKDALAPQNSKVLALWSNISVVALFMLRIKTRFLLRGRRFVANNSIIDSSLFSIFSCENERALPIIDTLLIK